MTNLFSITPTPPTSLELKPGEKGTFSFTVTSRAAPDKTHELILQAQLVGADGKGKEADWLAAGPQTLTMTGGETGTITITARPTDKTPRGAHSVKLVIASKAAPDDEYVDSPAVVCEVNTPITPPPPPPSRPHWWWIAAIAGGVVVLGGGALILRKLSGHDHVIAPPGDAARDAPPGDAARDAPPDAAATPKSCRAIHTANPALPSGSYTIDPDGPGGEAPISVTCDMVTDGGGWTIVFFAPTEAIDSLPITYTAGTAQLMADALQVLLAYRSATLDAYINSARFALPAAWRTQAPFNYPGDDVTTGVSINGGALVTATVRYGHANFSSACGDPWAPATDYGRICIIGTLAPFFSGFARVNTDLCCDSTQPYNTAACTNDKRFSIAVR